MAAIIVGEIQIFLKSNELILAYGKTVINCTPLRFVIAGLIDRFHYGRCWTGLVTSIANPGSCASLIKVIDIALSQSVLTAITQSDSSKSPSGFKNVVDDLFWIRNFCILDCDKNTLNYIGIPVGERSSPPERTHVRNPNQDRTTSTASPGCTWMATWV